MKNFQLGQRPVQFIFIFATIFLLEISNLTTVRAESGTTQNSDPSMTPQSGQPGTMDPAATDTYPSNSANSANSVNSANSDETTTHTTTTDSKKHHPRVMQPSGQQGGQQPGTKPSNMPDDSGSMSANPSASDSSNSGSNH